MTAAAAAGKDESVPKMVWFDAARWKRKSGTRPAAAELQAMDSFLMNEPPAFSAAHPPGAAAAAVPISTWQRTTALLLCDGCQLCSMTASGSGAGLAGGQSASGVTQNPVGLSKCLRTLRSTWDVVACPAING